MNCFSKDTLREFLLQELAADTQARVEQHVSSCAACCQTLDVLATDDLVRDYFEAARRDASNDEATASVAASSTPVALREVPDWQPFTTVDSQLPLQFGRFILKEVLGAGGFGVVYRAFDVNLEREVAVKIPHLGGLSPAVRQRFLQEGTAAANLHHPHIVQVHQSGTHRGVCFLVSEYCPGRTLRQLLDEPRGVGSAQLAARIVLPLADAVEHAHQNGVVHRDIKPANVILDARNAQDGLPYCPKLTDFGTARLVGADQSLTSSGMLIGTAPYMAPEQVSASGEIGPACDIYALGVLLYELIAGRLPIHGSDSADTIQKVVSFDPVPLHRLEQGVPRDISAICARCLEKRPDMRYGSATELASDLRRFLNGEPTIARPLGLAARLVRWSRRNPLPLTIMGTICLVFVLIFSGLAWHTARLRDLNDRLTVSNRQAFEMKGRAEQSELHAQRLRYASDIRLAEKFWRAGDFKSVRDILTRYKAKPGELDLRGLEWYFLERAVRKTAETIADHGSPLYCIRFAPDHESFVTAGEDAIIRLHDGATGELLQSIKSDQGEVNSIAFSPDGQALASAGDDGSVCLWRISDGARLDRFTAHDGMAFGVEFTPDAKRLVTCGTDKLVHVWKDGQKEFTHRDHTSRVEAIAVSPNGRWLASVGKDQTLVVRGLRTGELHLRWDEAHGTLSSVDFSPDSKTVAITEASGVTKWLRLFDLDSKSAILSREHPDGIRSVAFSPDGHRVLTTDNAGTARIWNVFSNVNTSAASEELQETWQAHNSRAYSGTFGPDGTSVLSVGQHGQVRRLNASEAANQFVLDRSRLSEITGFPEAHLSLHSVTFHPNDRDILAAAHVGIVIRKLESDNNTHFQHRGGDITWEHIAAPIQGGWFAVAGSTSLRAIEDGLLVPAVVERWDSAMGPARELLRTQSNCNIHDLSSSPSGDMLAVVVNEQLVDGELKRLLLLDSATGKILKEFPSASGTKPRFTRDGRWLVYAVQRDIHLVDLRNFQSRTIRDAHSSSQNGLSVSPDGKWLATCDEGRDLRIWNLATLQRHAVLEGHQGMITALDFSSDSRTLLSGSYDGTVKAWSVAAGQRLMDLHLGTEGVSDMALSADGTRLAVVEGKERIRLYLIGHEER